MNCRYYITSNIFASRGSPWSWLLMIVRLWHEARDQRSTLSSSSFVMSSTVPWNSEDTAGRTDFRSRPSSVNVPVWRTQIIFSSINSIVGQNSKLKFELFCLKWNVPNFFKIWIILLSLSKQISLSFPQTLILAGDIQNIPFFFNRF